MIAFLVRAVPVILAVLAEAAWISVVAGLVQEYVLDDVVLGILPLAAFVAAGLLVARRYAVRLDERWPITAVGLIIISAIAGVLLDPEAREAATSHGLGGIGSALAEHPAGIFAGIAMLRGFGHARLPLSDDRLGRMLGGGIVVISLAALTGGLVADPYRTRFLTDTVVAGVVFAPSVILALALTRQSIVGADSGVDWPRNPVWVALLVVLVVAVAAFAVPASAMVRPALELLIGVSIGPLLLIGLVAGWTRATLRLVGFVILVGAAIIALAPVIGGVAPPPAPPGQIVAGSVNPTVTDPTVLMVGGGILTAVALIVMLVLVRLWMRQVSVEADEVVEQRFIDYGESGPLAPRARFRLPFADRPQTAVAAYRALVRDIAGRRGVAREPSETPREHARRLRIEGRASLSLELLAADYALASYGGVGLSEREDRRAVGRWRALRKRLQAVPAPPVASPEELPPGLGQPRAIPRVDVEPLAPGGRPAQEPDM